MLLLAWTAALAILICAAILVPLLLLALLSIVLPRGTARTICQLLLAVLGLTVASLLVWG